MLSKSRHGKGKQSSRNKRKKSRHHFPAVVAQSAAAQSQKLVASPKSSTPAASTPAPRTTLTATRYPYVVAELRRIGILAGIMLVILIALAVVLS